MVKLFCLKGTTQAWNTLCSAKMMWPGSREESCFLSEAELWRRKKRFLLSWEQLSTFSCEARRKSAKRRQTKQIKDSRNKYTVYNQEFSHCWASKVTEKENSFLMSILGVQTNMSGSEEWRSWDENLRSKLRVWKGVGVAVLWAVSCLLPLTECSICWKLICSWDASGILLNWSSSSSLVSSHTLWLLHKADQSTVNVGNHLSHLQNPAGPKSIPTTSNII